MKHKKLKLIVLLVGLLLPTIQGGASHFFSFDGYSHILINASNVQGVSKAIIAVYDLNGLQLKEYPVYHHGKNTVTIEANEFKPGIYMYSFLVDGKLVDTKRMVITSK